jgi:membrane protease YdiL (CAAX protease family)
MTPSGPSPEWRALRFGNPVALFGTIGVGLFAMLLPDAVIIVAIQQGAAPSLDAMRAGASVPFPVLAATLVVRQATLIFGALAIAFLATSVRAARSDGEREGGAKELGFAKAPWIAVIAGSLGVVGLGPTSDLLVRILRSIAPSLEIGVLEQIDEIAGSQPLYVLWPLLALLPGLAEEAYFRGLVQGVFGRGAFAILGSGFVFAVFHLDPVQAAGVLPVGLYLAWLRDRTGSLWVPIAAHVANNSAAIFAARALPDLDPAGPSAPTPPLVIVIWLGFTAAAMMVVHHSSRRTRAA